MNAKETDTETVDLRVPDLWHSTPTRLQVAEGYAWRVSPGDEGALSLESEDGEDVDVGYYGLSAPPAAACYLADTHDGGYLVLTEDEDAPALVDGWVAEPAEIDEDWRYSDGSWTVVCVKVLDRGTADRPPHALFAGVS